MIRIVSIFLSLIAAISLQAGEIVINGIKFPIAAQEEKPQPKPSPQPDGKKGYTVDLPFKVLFVVESEKPLSITSTNERIAFDREAGESKIYGEFFEDRGVFKSKRTKTNTVILYRRDRGEDLVILFPEGGKDSDFIKIKFTDDGKQDNKQDDKQVIDDKKKDNKQDDKKAGPKKEVYIAVVRDPVSTTIKQTAILSDTDFWDSFKEPGTKNNWGMVAPSEQIAIDKKLAEAANKIQKPGEYQAVLIVRDYATGKNLLVTLLPESKEAIKKAIEDVR